MIGKLNKPTYSSVMNIPDSLLLVRCAFSKLKSKLFISDYQGGSIKIFDCNQNFTETIKHEKIKNPCSLYIDQYDNLFVSDNHGYNFKILIFDANINFIFEFELKNWKNVASVIVDELDNKRLLYVSSRTTNKIGIWNSFTGEFVNSLNIASPCNMCFSQDRLFVTSSSDYEVTNENKLCMPLSGSNCLFIVDKKSHLVLSRILNSSWLTPTGLYISNSSKIQTVARLLNTDGTILENRYLFNFDLDGNFRKKIELVEISSSKQSFNYIYFYEDKIAVVYNKSVKIIKY